MSDSGHAFEALEPRLLLHAQPILGQVIAEVTLNILPAALRGQVEQASSFDGGTELAARMADIASPVAESGRPH